MGATESNNDTLHVGTTYHVSRHDQNESSFELADSVFVAECTVIVYQSLPVL